MTSLVEHERAIVEVLANRPQLQAQDSPDWGLHCYVRDHLPKWVYSHRLFQEALISLVNKGLIDDMQYGDKHYITLL